MNNKINQQSKLLNFKLLILSIFLSAIVIVGTGIVIAYIWHQINYVNKTDLSNEFQNIPFIFTYTFSSLMAAILINMIWKRKLKQYYSRLINNTNNCLAINKHPVTQKTYLKYCIIIVIIAIMINLINSKIFLLPEITQWQKSLMISATKHNGGFLMFFLSAVVLAPLWEEIVFRGVIFTGLSLLLPKGVTVLLSAIFWSLAHSYQYSSIILTEIIIIGIVLGIARIKTNAIKVPIVLHITNNLIAFISMYYYSNNI